MKKEISAGILAYRMQNGELQVLLGKCGGPKYDKMSVGAWNIPKGHVEEGENYLKAALREFSEETSLELNITDCNELIDLGESQTKTGKVVKIYAIERDFSTDGGFKVEIQSNMCETEWPPRSGKMIEVPEMSEAFYFKMNVAKRMIFSYQKCFLTRLEEEINRLKDAKDNDIEEQIEGGAAATANASTAPSPGITGDTVFGIGKTCTDSLVKPKPKTDKDPGLTTSDIHSLYVLQNTKKKNLNKRVDLRKWQK